MLVSRGTTFDMGCIIIMRNSREVCKWVDGWVGARGNLTVVAVVGCTEVVQDCIMARNSFVPLLPRRVIFIA